MIRTLPTNACFMEIENNLPHFVNYEKQNKTDFGKNK